MITDMDLITWQLLGTYTGAAGAVLLITQLTKNIPFIKKNPDKSLELYYSPRSLISGKIFHRRTYPLGSRAYSLQLRNNRVRVKRRIRYAS